MLFQDNINYLLELTGIKQKSIADKIEISESAITKWKQGNIPSRTMLKRLARFFSETLHLDYALFEDGYALRTKNFQEITEQHLRHKEKPSQDSSPRREERGEAVDIYTFGQKLTALYNEDLGIMNSENYVPIPPDLLNTLLEFFAISHFNKELFLSFIRWGRTLGRSGHENGGY